MIDTTKPNDVGNLPFNTLFNDSDAANNQPNTINGDIYDAWQVNNDVERISNIYEDNINNADINMGSGDENYPGKYTL